MRSLRAHDDGHSLGRFVGVVRLGLGDEVNLGNAAAEQIVPANLALAVASGRSPEPSGGDDEWRHALLEQFLGVVQAGTVNRGWVANILRCAKDHDAIGALCLIDLGLVHNAGDQISETGPARPGRRQAGTSGQGVI